MTKYFTYNISNFKGYRLKLEESNLKCFSKIIYSGLKIVRSSTSFIHYEIDLKLIRNLKLKKIDDSIRKNSVEDRILQLMERSIEVEKSYIYPSSYPFSSYNSYGNYYDLEYSSGTYYYDDSEVEYNKSQNKDRNKYQSKIYSQKAKQYESKARFRK